MDASEADASSVGVPPPRYTLRSGARSRPKAASAASARSVISASSASVNASTREAGPRAAAPAYTTKSQYGQSETQNGTWT